jgi:excisionase family DNA binding protein
MEKNKKRWMRYKGVAEYLSVHPHNVYILLYPHRLPSAKLKGIVWRIDHKKLEKWIEEEIEEKEQKWREIFNWSVTSLPQ